MPVRVHAPNHKGKEVLDFKVIPLEQVGKLSEALTAERPPVPAVQLMEKAPCMQ